jgi:uncharacterized damage-inducible protein DinB
MNSELIKTFIDYHIQMTRRVWSSIQEITDDQFVAEDPYSRGSIRNLMVHLASTDRRWLAGLKNLPDVGHLKFEEYASKVPTRDMFELIAKDLAEYANTLNDDQLSQNANGIPTPREAILFHMINHGTDHRATVLQRLSELGAPTFDQDFITWLWSRK